ncbi:hypothetical protein ACFO1B_41730 [Dactylosporangium siamense]|uniref:Uncharacterized protein n=1 Tax=Dactylosporangium siamense TaxID=685454 RepID=A0A919PJ68_9ACTN|nr:hypothetical protein [Dactylosporangium siamense]GIG44909.1 hypothetical protein Dsi01nite_029500 [Dactylosporangium siamense]
MTEAATTSPALPDLSAYTLHRTVAAANLDGAAVPRLSAEFLHRPVGERTASIGRYRYGDAYVLLAWGWTDEEHCSFSSVLGGDGAWSAPQPGCPQFSLLRAGDEVTGVQLHDGTGGVVECRDGVVSRQRPDCR